MLFLITYIFLLRLPSEALPIVRGVNGVADQGQLIKKKAVLYLHDEQLCLKLSSRKNRPQGSLLKRGCWCKSANFLVCPVHVVWPYVSHFAVGQSVFEGIYPGLAINTLRKYMGLLEKPNAKKYISHDIRRGHADDLRRSGATLYEILTAGEWSSPAFLSYLDIDSLEADAVLEAHIDDSSSDDQDSGGD